LNLFITFHPANEHADSMWFKRAVFFVYNVTG